VKFSAWTNRSGSHSLYITEKIHLLFGDIDSQTRGQTSWQTSYISTPYPHLPMIALTFLGLNNNAKLGIYPLKNLLQNQNSVTDISSPLISFMILGNRDKAC
jgi:hypothetical protein